MAAKLPAYLLLVGLLTALPGCVQPGAGAPPRDSGLLAGAAALPTVVALLDSGIDPYHEAFRAPPGEGAERYAEAFGAQVVRLHGEGDHEARAEADAAVWEGLEAGRLYAFAGTRVLGVSVSRPPENPVLLDVVGHGTATASLVAREDPGALVVMVQFDTRACSFRDPVGHCPVFVETAPAMAWVAEQPWIHVVSSSLGYPANPPVPARANPDQAAFVAASRLAHESGKLVVGVTGNYAAPSLASQFAGPPWTIAVGGAQPAQRGEEADASKGGDVIANFTEWTATAGTLDGMDWQMGTSFAAPVTAGALSRALTLLRGQGAPPPAPADVRAALNATALAWSPAEWNAAEPASNRTGPALASRSLPVLLPTQAGWGYVHGGLAPELARRVLEGDLAPPPEKLATALYMARWQALREDYWRAQ